MTVTGHAPQPPVSFGPLAERPSPAGIDAGIIYLTTETPAQAFIVRIDSAGQHSWEEIATSSIAQDTEIHFDSVTGNDANDGTAGFPVKTWPRIIELWPKARYGTLSLIDDRIGGSTLTIDDLYTRLPVGLANAPPVQFFGQYAQDTSAGGTSGVHTVVGAPVANRITAVPGGMTASYARGAVLRRLSGAAWRRYSVTANAAATLDCSFPWRNGATPAPGDTFEIVFAVTRLVFDLQQFDLNGNILIMNGARFELSGANKRLIISNGVLYSPGCRWLTFAGRIGFERADHRTVDVEESSLEGAPPLPALRFPVQMPDMLSTYADGTSGLNVGDLYPGAESSFTMSLVTSVLGTDMVAEHGSRCVFYDVDIVARNNWQADGGSMVYYRSDAVLARSRWTSLNSSLWVSNNGRLAAVDMDITDNARDAVLVDTGGFAFLSGVTGTGNVGKGVKCQRGGSFVNDATNLSTVTGTTGDISMDFQGAATTVTWAQFGARGNSTERWLATSELPGLMTVNDFNKLASLPGPSVILRPMTGRFLTVADYWSAAGSAALVSAFGLTAGATSGAYVIMGWMYDAFVGSRFSGYGYFAGRGWLVYRSGGYAAGNGWRFAEGTAPFAESFAADFGLQDVARPFLLMLSMGGGAGDSVSNYKNGEVGSSAVFTAYTTPTAADTYYLGRASDGIFPPTGMLVTSVVASADAPFYSSPDAAIFFEQCMADGFVPTLDGPAHTGSESARFEAEDINIGAGTWVDRISGTLTLTASGAVQKYQAGW